LDGTGGVLLDWTDCRIGCQTFASRVVAGPTLAPGWPANGLRVSDAFAFYVALAPDGSGGAYLAWQIFPPSVVQHITAVGAIAPGWPQGGFRLASTYRQDYPSLVADGSGGAIAAWQDPARIGLFALRFAMDGPVSTVVSLTGAKTEPGLAHLSWFTAQ